jgi:hypothetical protein
MNGSKIWSAYLGIREKKSASSIAIQKAHSGAFISGKAG